jgi:hypothetical protein
MTWVMLTTYLVSTYFLTHQPTHPPTYHMTKDPLVI